MIAGPTRHTQSFIVSAVSIFLYSLVGIVSGGYFYKFYKIARLAQKDSPSYLTSIGRFDEAKLLFFGLLMTASFLEVPNYIGCLVVDAPNYCDWYSPSNLVFWFFHLFALCGYIVCIVIPCVLWSDMINKKDGKLVFSAFPYDFIKQFFRICLACYWINIALDILVSCFYYRLSDRAFYETAPTYAICNLIESVISVLIAVGCCYCGIKLQSYVMSAKLKSSVELRFLFSLNIIMIIILLSLFGRAVLIFGISEVAPSSFEAGISYTVFTFLSRWLPDIFCQLCLIYIMRYSGDEIMKRNQLMNNTATRSTGGDKGERPSLIANALGRTILLSTEYDVDSKNSQETDASQNTISPAVILAKELKNQPDSMRLYREDSNDRMWDNTGISNKDLSYMGEKRVFLESIDVENPQHRSFTPTSVSSSSFSLTRPLVEHSSMEENPIHFSTDSIRSPASSYRPSLDNGKL
jgi:hypothetical protein